MEIDIDLEEILKILTAVKSEDYATAETIWINLIKLDPRIIDEFRTNSKWINVRDAVETVFILKGAKAFKSGDYLNAEEAFKLVLKLEPGLHKVQTNLAFVFSRTGRYIEAEHIFREILKIEPNDFESQKWVARMLIKQQKWYEAEQYLQNLRKKYPTNRDILQLIDQIYQEKQQIASGYSQTEIGQLIEKGQSEFKLGHYNEAIEYYNHALIHAPNNAVLYIVIASSYFFLGQYEKAEKAIESALKLDPSSTEARFILKKIHEEH